jgi:hypothetical protein
MRACDRSDACRRRRRHRGHACPSPARRRRVRGHRGHRQRFGRRGHRRRRRRGGAGNDRPRASSAAQSGALVGVDPWPAPSGAPSAHISPARRDRRRRPQSRPTAGEFASKRPVADVVAHRVGGDRRRHRGGVGCGGRPAGGTARSVLRDGVVLAAAHRFPAPGGRRPAGIPVARRDAQRPGEPAGPRPLRGAAACGEGPFTTSPGWAARSACCWVARSSTDCAPERPDCQCRCCRFLHEVHSPDAELDDWTARIRSLRYLR